jgi:Cu+-exporting ATPase
MTCASCATRIERKLNRLDGVTATVNYSTEKARVNFSVGVTPEELVTVVEQAGYTARLPEPPRPTADDEVPELDPAAILRRKLIICTLLSVPVIAMAMIPALQFTYWQWLSLTLCRTGRGVGRVAVPRRGLEPTCGTAPRPWTRSSRSARWPRSAGRCTRCSSALPAFPA